MIIDFTITNFRSFKNTHTFSMYAEGSSEYLSNNITYPGNDKVGVLRTAGIYGANASGKSNLLLAFMALRYIICHSGDLKDGESITYEPYLLSESNRNSPIEFEVEFFAKKKRFVYQVAYDAGSIKSESLSYYPSRQKAVLFSRSPNTTWENIYFGSHYKGGRKKFPFFSNNSYLSKAGNSADAPKMIRDVYNFFHQELFHLRSNQSVRATNFWENQELVTAVTTILSRVDTGIDGIELEVNEDTTNIHLPEDMPERIKNHILEQEKKKPVFIHKGDDGKIQKFTEDMESAGTRKLFEILPLLIDSFMDGGVLIIDELDNSFHPHIAELIIGLFNQPSVNKNNAQLIFSTHNINLMNPNLFRRDQIWLAEKNHGESTLTCLDEFDKSSVKPNSPFNKWYEEGRFGAIPKIDIGSITSVVTGSD